MNSSNHATNDANTFDLERTVYCIILYQGFLEDYFYESIGLNFAKRVCMESFEAAVKAVRIGSMRQYKDE